MNRKKEQKMKKTAPNPTDPLYYVAFVLKGTEPQYLNLLKYINKRNGAQVIYQCKSLTYLRVTREDAVKAKTAATELSFEVAQQGGAT